MVSAKQTSKRKNAKRRGEEPKKDKSAIRPADGYPFQITYGMNIDYLEVVFDHGVGTEVDTDFVSADRTLNKLT